MGFFNKESTFPHCLSPTHCPGFLWGVTQLLSSSSGSPPKNEICPSVILHRHRSINNLIIIIDFDRKQVSQYALFMILANWLLPNSVCYKSLCMLWSNQWERGDPTIWKAQSVLRSSGKAQPVAHRQSHITGRYDQLGNTSQAWRNGMQDWDVSLYSLT